MRLLASIVAASLLATASTLAAPGPQVVPSPVRLVIPQGPNAAIIKKAAYYLEQAGANGSAATTAEWSRQRALLTRYVSTAPDAQELQKALNDAIVAVKLVASRAEQDIGRQSAYWNSQLPRDASPTDRSAVQQLTTNAFYSVSETLRKAGEDLTVIASRGNPAGR